MRKADFGANSRAVLVDERLGDASCFALEDFGQGLRAPGLIVFSSRVLCQVAEGSASGGAVSADGHGRDGDFQIVHRLDGSPAGWAGIAVADHDHVLDCRVFEAGETSLGQHHGRIELGHVAGHHLADPAEHDVSIGPHGGHTGAPEPLGCRLIVVVKHAAHSREARGPSWLPRRSSFARSCLGPFRRRASS